MSRRTRSVIRKQRKRNIAQAEELEKAIRDAEEVHQHIAGEQAHFGLRLSEVALEIVAQELDRLKVKLAKKEVTIDALTRELRGEMRIG